VADALLDERLAHRCCTDQYSTTGGQWWPVDDAPTVEASPVGMSTPTCAAWLVPDEHRAGAEGVTVRAALRWPCHP